MSEFLQEHAKPIFDELQKIADTHAQLSNGLLVPLESVPSETHTTRDILRHTIKGEPLDPIELNELAVGVDNRFRSLYNAVELCAEVEQIEETLRSGQNVILAMGHDELIDAALVPLAIANIIRLRNPDLVDRKGRSFFRTSLIASRMVEFLGAPMLGGIVPVTDLFGNAFDETYMTVPSTLSTKGRFDKKAVRIYNDIVTRSISSSMERRAFSNRRPLLLAMAAPGTIDKPLDTYKYEGTEIAADLQDSTIVVGQINYHITDFAKHALTYAAIAKLGQESSDVRIDPRHINTRDPVDVEKLAERIIGLLKSRDPEINYVYDKNASLPVVRHESSQTTG